MTYYGHWLLDEAVKRIGHLYPKAKVDDGTESDVIAWLWARTVRSPDPAAKGAMVPLVSSFILATREGRKVWVEPKIDRQAPDGWRFHVSTGSLSKSDEARLKLGTKSGRGTFECILTGAPIPEDWTRAEGKAGRLGKRLMAVVAEGKRARVYLGPDSQPAPAEVEVNWVPEGELYEKALGFRVPGYGFTRWSSLFTSRQLATLGCLADLIAEARARCAADAAGQLPNDDRRLSAGGQGFAAYADAIATYLALALNRAVMGGNTLVRWNAVGEKAQHAFGRQALPMVWDFAETNLLGNATGSFASGFEMAANSLLFANSTPGSIVHADAAQGPVADMPVVISTDPPYYDNVGYADLSDFFYVWLRKSASEVWPELFRRLATPKDQELVATPHRHGGKSQAEAFFMRGMGQALRRIRNAATDAEPITIYYAFKQSEMAADGVTSSGWATFLQAIVDADLVVDGTWPLRTEMATRMRGQGSNALAASIVLVCRKRVSVAQTITRAELIRSLKRELPEAIDNIRKAGVGPVDMQQSVIGPGMGVFSRYERVLEDDDSAMSVRTALSLVNRVWEEIENELDTAFDAETQVAIAWFGSYGFDVKSSGELITLANAKNVSLDALFASGVFSDLRGRAALTPREELPLTWDPAKDTRLTVWECVQHTARVLRATDGGAAAAAALVKGMGPKGDEARKLAYRLFEISTQKGWAAEALVYNELAEEWPKLEALASREDEAPAARTAPAQAELF